MDFVSCIYELHLFSSLNVTTKCFKPGFRFSVKNAENDAVKMKTASRRYGNCQMKLSLTTHADECKPASGRTAKLSRFNFVGWLRWRIIVWLAWRAHNDVPLRAQPTYKGIFCEKSWSSRCHFVWYFGWINIKYHFFHRYFLCQSALETTIWKPGFFHWHPFSLGHKTDWNQNKKD